MSEVVAFDSAWAGLPTYLRAALAPLRVWLADARVVEISVNRPGEVFVEILGAPAMERHDVPDLTSDAIRRMAQQVASETKQAVNEETPLLSAALPHGERFQAVLSPAAPSGGAISIRKQVVKNLTLAEFEKAGGLELVNVSAGERLTETDRRLIELLDSKAIGDFLRLAIKERISMVISGGTSTGKTTFLNALLKEVPLDERIVSIEDTRELQPPHPNYVPLIASKGDQGMSRVTIQDLLEASLRMRPDRLFLGEVRGAEAFSFLQAINTGHPGSMTTVHANSPLQAYDRLALMSMQAGLGLSKAEIVDYIRSVIPIVVQLSRHGGQRAPSEIQFVKYGAGRG
ncbi:type IV secretion system protein VirB11 [Rhizobiales bacterium GAS191]|nr:type IV secretion system protein VirB11 [Rhizobiales bacterium GAS191]